MSHAPKVASGEWANRAGIGNGRMFSHNSKAGSLSRCMLTNKHEHEMDQR
jgi:hypothetical protein